MVNINGLEPLAAPAVRGAGSAVLAAASQLFYDQGIHATSVDAVAERAGVTKRTVYQHFHSKDALVAAYLLGRAHTWQHEVLGRLRGDSSHPLAVIYGLAGEWSRRHARGCAFVNAWAEIGRRDHPAMDVVIKEKEWMRRLLTLVAAGDVRTGSALHQVYEGAQVNASIQRSGAPLEVALEASHRLLCIPHS